MFYIWRTWGSKNLLIFSWFVTKKIMMKNSKLKFSEYMQNINRSKNFGKFVLTVLLRLLSRWHLPKLVVLPERSFFNWKYLAEAEKNLRSVSKLSLPETPLTSLNVCLPHVQFFNCFVVPSMILWCSASITS